MDFRTLIQKKREMETSREEQYKVDSKARLEVIVNKKMTTTMIGALAAIEENFGFLWDGNSTESLHMKQVFEKVRKKILDNGNDQIKAVKEEFKLYDIVWLRYQMEF